MMNREFSGRVISAAMLLASSACAYGIGGGDAAPQAGAGRPVQLQVDNTSGVPVEVYASGSGMSYRVGTVHPGIAQRFALRPGLRLNGAVEFVARTADGRMLRSGPMLLKAGDVVDLDLTPHTSTSNATVRAWR